MLCWPVFSTAGKDSGVFKLLVVGGMQRGGEISALPNVWKVPFASRWFAAFHKISFMILASQNCKEFSCNIWSWVRPGMPFTSSFLSQSKSEEFVLAYFIHLFMPFKFLKVSLVPLLPHKVLFKDSHIYYVFMLWCKHLLGMPISWKVGGGETPVPLSTGLGRYLILCCEKLQQSISTH